MQILACGMRDLVPTRDGSQAFCTESTVLATGQPGKSPGVVLEARGSLLPYMVIFCNYSWVHEISLYCSRTHNLDGAEDPFHPSATLEHKEKEFPEAKAEWIRILHPPPSIAQVIPGSPPLWGHRQFWLCCLYRHVSESKHRSLLLSALCDFVASFTGWWRDKNSHSSFASNSLLHPKKGNLS